MHNNTCAITMAAIAGSYRLAKYELVSYNTGAAQDLTSTLNSCQLSGIYNFNIDSTAAYTELNNCSGSGSGRWGLSGTSFYTSFTSGEGSRINLTSITSWDCTSLVLTTSFPSAVSNIRYTLTKF